MAIKKVITRGNVGVRRVILRLLTIYGDLRDILVSEGLEEFLQAIIDNGLVTFWIGDLLYFSGQNVYL